MAVPELSSVNYVAMWEKNDWPFFLNLASYPLSVHPDRERLALMFAGAALQLDNAAESSQLLDKALALVETTHKLRTFMLASHQVQLGKAAFVADKQAEALTYFQKAWVEGGRLIKPLFYPFLCEAAEHQLQSGEVRAAIQTWQDVATIIQEHTPKHVYHRMSYCYSVNHKGFGGSKEENRLWGDCHKHDVLEYFHQQLQPDFYFEIGVDEGLSLVHAKGKALGIDARPELKLGVELPSQTQIIGLSSDEFFRDCVREAFSTAPDLAFIDGMHLFEFALRDFINLERYSAPHTLVAIDDIYPCHPVQAERRRRSGAWTGDVWKLLPVLQKYRPDLLLIPLRSYTTGLLLIAGLDASNKELEHNYYEILRDYHANLAVPESILKRQGSIASNHSLLSLLLTQLKTAKETGANRNQVVKALQLLKPLLQQALQLPDTVSGPKTMELLAIEEAHAEAQKFTVRLFFPQGREPVEIDDASIKEKLQAGQWQEVFFSFTYSSIDKPISFGPAAKPGLIEVASIRMTDNNSGLDILSLFSKEQLDSLQIGGDAFKVEHPERFLVYSYADNPVIYFPIFHTHEAEFNLTIVLRLVTDIIELRNLWSYQAG